ncbi:GNAT family N-acetyltransferase [Shinella zoogloeoides]|uniref:GNAT family N-acetyltransferase n=1 Tax=Shinella zoogloeoides TaxID=352475 RepID=UPI000E65B9E0|nr:GNAT family N-acetyltransferase [Shinella zoogloeoides]
MIPITTVPCSGYTVEPAPISDSSEPIWRDLFCRDGTALPSQSPEWARAVTDAGGFRALPQFFKFDDGSRAVLPLFVKGAGRLRYAWSPPPAWGFGGVLSDGEMTPAKLSIVLEHLETLPSLGFKIRPNPLTAGLWAQAARPGWSAIDRCAHVIDLAGGFLAVRARFRPNAGTYIRRAQKSGVEIEVGNHEGLIDEFHHLLQLSLVRWARKQHEPAVLARMRGLRRDPKAKFITMASQMGDRFRLYVARLNGRAVAAILVLMGRQAHYTRGAVDEALAGESRAAYLLQATAIEDACRFGCTHYHMGETGNSASLAQFKSRFGAVAVPYCEYRYETLPLARLDGLARRTVKRILGFRDAP